MSVGIENPVHLLFIAVVALIVLGPKRLPALARALGQAVREFRASLEQGSESPGELESSAHASGGDQAMGEPTHPPGQSG
ncbi:MAG: twin-arginine translocase TatA/TatE family subunit [Actinobacteria bacterium]|nr:MAG: twin-arginine translocase TatA/TatE family subunit [Actinomycetota bacterium]